MTTLKASGLKAVLDRARNVGQVEEPATIAGVSLVFRSLEPETYLEISEAVADSSETSSMTTFQMEHVCRSIVEIEGQDLRDVKFIEVEEIDADGKVRSHNVERHQWVRDLISTWSNEAVFVAFRKVLDVISLSEKRASAGVDFRIEEESAEDKCHRLLAEAGEALVGLPDEVKEAILKKHGLLEATSEEELRRLSEEAKRWVSEQAATLGETEQVGEPELLGSEQPAAPTHHQEPVRAPQQLVQAAEELASPQAPQDVPQAQQAASVQEKMASRQPLNQEPAVALNPPREAQQQGVRRSPRPLVSQVAAMSASQRRAQEYAALEQQAAAESGTPLPLLDGDQQVYRMDSGSSVLEERVDMRVDKAAIQVNRPPVQPLNPKFVNPHTNPLNPRTRGR